MRSLARSRPEKTSSALRRAVRAAAFCALALGTLTARDLKNTTLTRPVLAEPVVARTTLAQPTISATTLGTTRVTPTR